MSKGPLLIPLTQADVALRRTLHHARRLAREACARLHAIGSCGAKPGQQCIGCPRRALPVMHAAVELAARDSAKRPR
jgi:hypothetical protein